MDSLIQMQTLGLNSNTVHLLDGTQFEIDEVVRAIPFRRLVCRARLGGNNVFVKIFLGKKFEHYASRDREGIDSLVKNRILTPMLIHHGFLENQLGYVLIFKEIENVFDAQRVYENASQVDLNRMANNLILALASHHNAGLIQTDLYLKNFLVDGNDIYTLDGDGIRHYPKLTKSKALSNLAVLLSKFDVLEIEAWLPKLLKLYADARGWQITPDLNDVIAMINRQRIRVASHYADKKVFRQCTDVAVYDSSRYFQAIARGFDLNQLPIGVEACDVLIDSGIRLKSGNTCTVSLATVEGVSVVVKRYNIKSFFHGVSRAFRQTRAAASWANAYRLNILGILTPKPIVLIEKRFFGLRGKAYFLSEFVDAPDVKSFFEQIKNKNTEAAAIKEIAKLFYRLYLLKLSHGDLKYSNIKMLDGNPCLIDLDSLRQHQWTYFALKGHVHDLRRFMRNWQDQPTLYNTFIKEFSAVYADHQALRLAGLIN